MESPLLPYLPLAILIALSIVMAAVLVLATRLLGPRNPTDIKRSPFETGSDPVGTARERFSVKFYMVALLFIVFDIEAVFIYPWAVLLRDLGWPAMASMLVFMATLVVGLIYVWKKGALKWT